MILKTINTVPAGKPAAAHQQTFGASRKQYDYAARKKELARMSNDQLSNLILTTWQGSTVNPRNLDLQNVVDAMQFLAIDRAKSLRPKDIQALETVLASQPGKIWDHFPAKADLTYTRKAAAWGLGAINQSRNERNGLEIMCAVLGSVQEPADLKSGIIQALEYMRNPLRIMLPQGNA